MAKGRVSREKRLEVCDWVQERADKLQAEAGAEAAPEAEEQNLNQAIDEASAKFGLRTVTIRGWYEKEILKGSPLPEPAPKVRRKRGPKPRAAKAERAAGEETQANLAVPMPRSAAGITVEEALAVIGEMVLAAEGVQEAPWEVLVALGRRHLEWRAKEREIRELRRRLGE